MSGLQCPYCSMFMSVSDATVAHRFPAFSYCNGDNYKQNGKYIDPTTLKISFFKCPNCGQYTISVSGAGNAVKDINMQIRPLSRAKHYPNYIPENILNDYKEACAIVDLSPKASATLARRCLQGMIRDFFGIHKKLFMKKLMP